MVENKDILPSLYEGFIFYRADAIDLAHRHADEVTFLHLIKPLSIAERRDYYLSGYMHLCDKDDKDGKERLIEHRLFPMVTYHPKS